TRQGCKRHERGGSAILRCRRVNSHGLADPPWLQEARARWLGELAVLESKLARVSRPSKVARGTSEVARRSCGAGKKVNSHGLADPPRLQEARARWLGDLAVQESKLARVSRPAKVARGTSETRQGCKRHERGGSAILRCRKVNSHGLADPPRLQEARARWLGDLAVQESKLARVSRPAKVARGTSEVARRSCGAGKKVNSHGLADPPRLQEARARWLGDLAVQESKLARVSRPAKVARGTSETRQGCKRHERGGSAILRCRKVNSHGLADPPRLQEARARWLGDLAVQESKLARVSRPAKVARGTSEVARRSCGAGKKVNSHGLADPPRLQEARARWLGDLAVQESKLARVSRPAKVARGTSETRQGCKRHERGGSAILRCRKVNSHGLADPPRLQEARARWLGDLAVQESKLARVSRPAKVARGTSEVARRSCGAGKKVNSHGLADPPRLQEARARWLGDLAVQESKLARVSRPAKVARGTSETRQGCKRHERGGSAILRCRKVNSHGLADPPRLQEARARWLGDLAVQESKLARVSRPAKVARGTSEVARRSCGAGKKVNSHGLADPPRLQEARARWLGDLAVQESKLARVSRPAKVARGTSETRQGCKRHERGGSAILRCRKVNSHGLADPPRLQEARARWLGDLAVQESKLARVSRPAKVARGTSEVARRTCGAGK
ncbi:hypothetical protein CRG98_034599, partial [Punica granatum]